VLWSYLNPKDQVIDYYNLFFINTVNMGTEHIKYIRKIFSIFTFRKLIKCETDIAKLTETYLGIDFYMCKVVKTDESFKKITLKCSHSFFPEAEKINVSAIFDDSYMYLSLCDVGMIKILDLEKFNVYLAKYNLTSLYVGF
jgi:hypothetical protein